MEVPVGEEATFVAALTDIYTDIDPSEPIVAIRARKGIDACLRKAPPVFLIAVIDGLALRGVR